MNKIYTHFIDAGHGGTDPGAIGKRGTHEADLNLDISKRIGRILLQQGQKVMHSRTTDKFLTLAQRADIANKSSCDTFTSIHCNSATEVKANGIETFSHTLSTEGPKLSKCIQTELISATKLTDRGCKTANFGVLRMSNMVATLIECAFISNTEEEILLMQEDFREMIALSVVKGIFKYLNLEFKESKKFPLELKVINEAAAIAEKPVKIFKANDLITAIGEDDNFYILDIRGKKAYIEKCKTIKR